MTTEPAKLGNPVFHACMNNLLDICHDFSLRNEKPVTHAINILRAIYRHTQLGEIVAPYLESGMMVALNGFSSSSWGVNIQNLFKLS